MSEKTTNTPPKYKRSPALNASIILVFLSIVLLITLAMFVSFDEVTNRFEAGKVDIVLTEPHWKPKNGEETVPNTFIDKDPTIINKEDTVNTYVFLEVTIPYDDDPALIIDMPYEIADDNKAGSKAYENKANDGKAKAKIPYYKFIATGNNVNTDDYDTNFHDAKLIDANDGYYKNTDDFYSSKQNVNSNWYLLNLGEENGVPKNPSINETNKTFTYVYAYVVDSTAENPTLEHLIPGGVVEVPLFNKIYVMNVRERAEVKNNNEVTTTPFPDDSRDYSIHINAYGIQANFLENGNSTKTVPEDVWEMLKSGSTTTP